MGLFATQAEKDQAAAGSAAAQRRQQKGPPVEQRLSVANGCVECAKRAVGDCTIRGLTVSVEIISAESKTNRLVTTNKPRILTTDRRKRGEKTRTRDRELVELLNTYDLVMDVVTDAPTQVDPKPPSHIKLLAEGKHTGKCAYGTHPVVYMVPLDECVELPPGGAVWRMYKSDKEEFRAQKFFFSAHGSSNPLGFIVGLIAQMMTLGGKRLNVHTDSCGVKGILFDGALRDFNCLVRIYRKDKWALKLEIPGRKLKKLDDKLKSLGRDPFKASTEAYDAADTSRRENAVVRQNGPVQRGQGATNAQVKQNRQAAGVALAGHRDARDGGPGIKPKIFGAEGGIKLERNGVELEVQSFKEMLAGLVKIFDMIRDFQTLLKRAPCVGFSFSFDVSFFEGGVELSLERDNVDDMAEDGRHFPVEWKVELAISILLLKLEVVATFGAKFDAGWLASAEATLNGSFSTEIKIEGKIERTSSKGEVKAEIICIPKVTAKVWGVVKASAVGVDLLEVRVTLEGGVSFMDIKTLKAGGLSWSSDKGFRIKGDLCTTPTTLTVTRTSVAGSAEPSQWEVFPPKQLMKLATPD